MPVAIGWENHGRTNKVKFRYRVRYRRGSGSRISVVKEVRDRLSEFKFRRCECATASRKVAGMITIHGSRSRSFGRSGLRWMVASGCEVSFCRCGGAGVLYGTVMAYVDWREEDGLNYASIRHYTSSTGI